MEKTYGILVRVYTPKPEEVPDRVVRSLKHAQQIEQIREEFSALRRVLFLIPRDYDCGQTAGVLSQRFLAEGFSDVEVHAFHGHHSCEVLNEGLHALAHYGISHALVVSGKALSYLKSSTLLAMDQKFAEGAKVSGLATDELREIVLSGRIQNTFAGWDIAALLDQHAFDSKGGVEEVAPLIRLARRFGRCIAPIDIDGGVLDVHASETAVARHKEVMATKIARQTAECERLNSSFQFIQDAVM